MCWRFGRPCIQRHGASFIEGNPGSADTGANLEDFGGVGGSVWWKDSGIAFVAKKQGCLVGG